MTDRQKKKISKTIYLRELAPASPLAHNKKKFGASYLEFPLGIKIAKEDRVTK